MRWFRSTIEGAGLQRYSASSIAAIILLAAFMIGALAQSIFHVTALSFFLSLGFAALLLEALSTMATKRRRNFAALWPEITESIQSAISAGFSLLDAFDELARTGPFKTRGYFQALTDRIDNGATIDESLKVLKREIGSVHSDRLVETLRLVLETGSERLGQILAGQAQSIRNHLATDTEIASKQSWVASIAKLAVASPWIIVGLLSIRPENAAIYNSASGQLILAIGFVVSLIAYRLVHVLGEVPSTQRIFSNG